LELLVVVVGHSTSEQPLEQQPLPLEQQPVERQPLEQQPLEQPLPLERQELLQTGTSTVVVGHC
jgi:hypothetical protein